MQWEDIKSLLLAPSPFPNACRRSRRLLLLLCTASSLALRSSTGLLLAVLRRLCFLFLPSFSLLGRWRSLSLSVAVGLRLLISLALLSLGLFALLLLLVATGVLFLDLQLRLVLYDVIARAGEVNGWVVGLGVFLDRVAALRLDGDFAFGFLFCDLATGRGSVPIPGG